MGVEAGRILEDGRRWRTHSRAWTSNRTGNPSYIGGSSRDKETAFGFISFCPLRIEHHSLCSAMGIPHSTQTRTRLDGSVRLVGKKRLRNDIGALIDSLARQYVTGCGLVSFFDRRIVSPHCRACLSANSLPTNGNFDFDTSLPRPPTRLARKRDLTDMVVAICGE
jgi:hypothetical protein